MRAKRIMATGIIAGAIAAAAAATAMAAPAAVTAESAKSTALAHAGLRTDQVTGLVAYQDYDDGRVEFEGSFFYNNMEYEFSVDGSTGSIIEWEVESIYD